MEYKRLRDVVTHPRYEELEKHISQMRERAVANLSYADAPVEIHRYQGQISILDQLLKLKANVINDGNKK
mgnify:FL=1